MERIIEAIKAGGLVARWMKKNQSPLSLCKAEGLEPNNNQPGN